MIIHATDADFNEFLSKNDKVIVKFYADWCGTCKLFAPKYKRMSDEDRFVGVAFLEINAEENPLARKSSRVSNLPFMAVFKGGSFLEGAATAKEEAVTDLINKLN